MEASMWGKLIAVFIGSGLGGMCRWAVSQVPCTSWPAGTLIANVGGCFLLGWLSRMAPGSEMVRMLLMTVLLKPRAPTGVRMLLMTGFCGGFTTFSTFTNESLLMLRTGQLLPLALYAGGSLVLGLCAAALGYKCM